MLLANIASFALVLALMGAGTASGQDYANKPIRLVVPSDPGGGADFVGRILARQLSDALNQSVVVDNRGGASGIVGTEMVAKAIPDGYTLLLALSSHPIIVSLVPNLPFDMIKDFSPVTQATSQPYVMCVHPGVAAKSVKEFIALAKSKPGQLNYASGGSGTGPHLGGELLKTMAGINIVHVPYKGGGPALVALLSGQVDMLLSSPLSTLSQAKAGKVRALAVTGTSRLLAYPDLPTVAESGVPGYELINWYGIMAPARTPKAIVTRLHNELVKKLNAPAFKADLAKDGTDVVGNTPDEFAAHLKSEVTKWAKVIKLSNTHLD